MSKPLPIQVNVAPGGFIPDTPDNQDLLLLIANTPKLDPNQIASLAIFYQAYATTAALGDHLMEVLGIQALCVLEWVDDAHGEDTWCGYDATTEEKNEKVLKLQENKFNSKDFAFRVHSKRAYRLHRHSTLLAGANKYEFKSVPYLIPGINLLIETINDANPHIIGFTPPPNDNVQKAK